jgi:hypothetical protein
MRIAPFLVFPDFLAVLMIALVFGLPGWRSLESGPVTSRQDRLTPIMDTLGCAAVSQN